MVPTLKCFRDQNWTFAKRGASPPSRKTMENEWVAVTSPMGRGRIEANAVRLDPGEGVGTVKARIQRDGLCALTLRA